ncbi:MAG: glycosyltransferase family 4 protein [Candidatus Micrarchaeia archaeon]
MKVLIMDMGSRMNRFGGEARVAAQLYHKLKRYFSTYYFGYETYYIKPAKQDICIRREKVKLSRQMRTKLSENWIMRAGYYFLSGRLSNLGISKKTILEYAKRIKPDVIIANSIADFPIIRYLRSNGMEFKTLYIDHVNLSMDTFSGMLSKNSLPLTMGSGIIACGTNAYKRKFLGFFDRCIALNLEQKERMERFTKNVVYIPNGISNAKGDSSISKRFLNRYGLRGKFIVLYVGRMFERQKNVSTLIKAFKMIKGEDKRLAIVGDGPSLNDYVEIARGDNRIVFTGSVDDSMLSGAYRAASLYVLPSLWEGFSITMLEAASHGTAMLLSKNACPKDFEKEGIKVDVFDPYNVTELAKKIEMLGKSRRLLKRARSESRKIAEVFGEDKMIEKYRNILLSLED